MRCIVLSLAILPSALGFGILINHKHVDYKHAGGPGAGRGNITPPTVAEMKEAKCLATMVYGEARGEARTGKVAVAYTALNRAVKTSVCDVVLAPKQYSIFNDNPALRLAALSYRLPASTKKNVQESDAWKESMEVAELVVRRSIPDPTKGSTHYLAPKAMEALGYAYPEWSRQYRLVAVIDNHKFYKKS